MFSHILVPVDGNPGAEAALPVAAELATKLGAVVVLFEVTPGYGQGTAAVAAQTAASAYLEGLRAKYGTPKWQTVVAEGHSSSAIVEQAKKSGTDLIIMATHARAGVKRLFLGSVAEDVIRAAGIPVLVVHSNEEE